MAAPRNAQKTTARSFMIHSESVWTGVKGYDVMYRDHDTPTFLLFSMHSSQVRIINTACGGYHEIYLVETTCPGFGYDTSSNQKYCESSN